MADLLFMDKSVWEGVGKHDDEKPSPAPPPLPRLPSRDRLADMFKSSNLDTSPVRQHRHTPKVQSNLLKTWPPQQRPQSPHSHDANLVKSGGRLAVDPLDRAQLVECIGERERQLMSAADEYDKHYETYRQLCVKFYTEKLNNLKLTFKNQILKQKIYFETEMLELSREYTSDFEQNMKSIGKGSTTSSKKNAKNKESKNKQLIKMLNSDLRTLLEYMRESLINSADTLIESHETCECLKRLKQTDASLSRQHAQMHQSTYNLLNKSKQSSGSGGSAGTADDVTDEEARKIDKYKSDVDELMLILDDIELAHLHRKEQLNVQCKFANKLRAKFKYIEDKYEALSRQVAALRFESYVFKELWAERQRAKAEAVTHQQQQQQHQSSQQHHQQHQHYDGEVVNPSRSTSTSSLADPECCELLGSAQQRDEYINSSASSSASSSSSMMSNHDENLGDFDPFDSNSLSTSDDDSSSDSTPYLSNDDIEPKITSSMSTSDYNRKLALITDLINLHKSKSFSSSASSTACNRSSISDVWIASEGSTAADDMSSSSLRSLGSTTRLSSRCYYKTNSSLGLVECSHEGDRVCVENCDMRHDRDLSGCVLERYVDGVDEPPLEYTLPPGSLVKGGKVLRLEHPFAATTAHPHHYIVECLTAIAKFASTSSTLSAVPRLTITTRLLTPDRRNLMASHTQEIPHFYREIFKYANLIRFL